MSNPVNNHFINEFASTSRYMVECAVWSGRIIIKETWDSSKDLVKRVRDFVIALLIILPAGILGRVGTALTDAYASKLETRAFTHLKENDLNSALNVFNQALAINPSSSRTLRGRADVHTRQNRLSLAIADLNAASKLEVSEKLDLTAVVRMKSILEMDGKTTGFFAHIVPLSRREEVETMGLAEFDDVVRAVMKTWWNWSINDAVFDVDTRKFLLTLLCNIFETLCNSQVSSHAKFLIFSSLTRIDDYDYPNDALLHDIFVLWQCIKSNPKVTMKELDKLLYLNKNMILHEVLDDPSNVYYYELKLKEKLGLVALPMQIINPDLKEPTLQNEIELFNDVNKLFKERSLRAPDQQVEHLINNTRIPQFEK